MNSHRSKLNSNVSLRPDKDLRPWCHNAEREEDLKKCYVELQRVIQRTAPMTKGGCFGPSVLDKRSEELQELEKFIRDPDKYIRENYEQPKVLKANHDEKPAVKKDTTKHHQPVAQYYDDEPIWSDEQIEAGIRLAVQKKFGSTGHRVTRFVSATLDPKKKSIYGPQRRKDPLASVKYVPKPRLGPALHDIGAADFQRFLLRQMLRRAAEQQGIPYHEDYAEADEGAEEVEGQEVDMGDHHVEVDHQIESELAENTADNHIAMFNITATGASSASAGASAGVFAVPEEKQSDAAKDSTNAQMMGSIPSALLDSQHPTASPSKFADKLRSSVSRPSTASSSRPSTAVPRPSSAPGGRRPGSSQLHRPSSASPRAQTAHASASNNDAHALSQFSDLLQTSTAIRSPPATPSGGQTRPKTSKFPAQSQSQSQSQPGNEPDISTMLAAAASSAPKTAWAPQSPSTATSATASTSQLPRVSTPKSTIGVPTTEVSPFANDDMPLNSPMSSWLRDKSVSFSSRQESRAKSSSSSRGGARNAQNRPSSASAAAPVTIESASPRLSISREGTFSLADVTVPMARPHTSKTPAAATAGPQDPAVSTGTFNSYFNDSDVLDGHHHEREERDDHLYGKILSKRRIKEAQTLREQLMTQSGLQSINVRPDAGKDCIEDNLRSLEYNKEFVKELAAKGKIDSTWKLLCTPGFLELQGAEKVFKSDSHSKFVFDDKFKKALEEIDLTNGIKRDPMRELIESAARNQQKLFQPSGAFKMN